MRTLDPVKKYPGIMESSPNRGVVIQGGDEGLKSAGIYVFKLLILYAAGYVAVIDKY
jgi:hypothetical protein